MFSGVLEYISYIFESTTMSATLKLGHGKSSEYYLLNDFLLFQLAPGILFIHKVLTSFLIGIIRINGL